MTKQHVGIRTFVEAALADTNVSFDELEDATIEPRSSEERRLVDEFWNELMLLVNDYDVRMGDAEYNTNRKRRLQNAFDAVVKAGLLKGVQNTTPLGGRMTCPYAGAAGHATR